ncbi:hypothetical protein GCM10009862_26750 [Microbacterium binotii]|uniref:Uncharacterized protein n=1 Tax=Microbacterium binotii TaxID=462710 RepID=A0ABN3PJI8_9MICO
MQTGVAAGSGADRAPVAAEAPRCERGVHGITGATGAPGGRSMVVMSTKPSPIQLLNVRPVVDENGQPSPEESFGCCGGGSCSID